MAVDPRKQHTTDRASVQSTNVPVAGDAAKPEEPVEKMHPRAHPRMPMMRTINVVELNDRGEPAGTSEAQSIDISRGGLAFVSRDGSPYD